MKFRWKLRNKWPGFSKHFWPGFGSEEKRFAISLLQGKVSLGQYARS
jgi:hypothetical protein